MGLETFTGAFINGLDEDWPIGNADEKSEGDNHLRGIKEVLKNSFPQITGAVNANHTELNYLDGVSPGLNAAFKAPVLDGSGDLELTAINGDVNCINVGASAVSATTIVASGTVSAGTLACTTVTATTITASGTINCNTINPSTDLIVQDGGTGRSSHVAYTPICGGTTTTGDQQSVASLGTDGYVLTSNGAGALPSFKAPTGTGGGLTEVDNNDWVDPGGAQLTVDHGGTGVTSIAAGTILIGGSSTAIAGVSPGTNGYVLTMSGGSPAWAASGAGTGDVIKVGTPVNNQVGTWTGDGTIEGDSGLTFDTATDRLVIGASGDLYFGAVSILTDASGTMTLRNIDAIDTATENTLESAIDSLPYLTVVGTLNTGDATAIVDTASAGQKGIVELATIAETNTGTDATRAVTPDGLDSWTGSTNITTIGAISTIDINGGTIDGVNIGANGGGVNLASSGVTGITQGPGNDTARIATTAFVQQEITANAPATIYSGSVDGTTTTVSGDSGFTCSGSSGNYTLTHNLGTTNYNIVLTAAAVNSVSFNGVQYGTKASNTITLFVMNTDETDSALIAADFDFMLTTY